MSSLGNIVDRVPAQYDKSNVSDVIRAITTPLGLILDGKIQPVATATTVPSGTAQAYQKGDVVRDSNPTVIGSVAPGVAASYVRFGWICTSPGSPGTWQEIRVLTGS